MYFGQNTLHYQTNVHPMKKQSERTTIAREPELAISKAQGYYDIGSLLRIASTKIDEPFDRFALFRAGIGRKSFLHLKEATGLDYQTLAIALSVSTKTLQRTEVFDTVQSEKLYELAGLYSVGMSYFGKDGFRRWMERPLFTLGNRKPLDLLDVSEGIKMLIAEIRRLQHGIAV